MVLFCLIGAARHGRPIRLRTVLVAQSAHAPLTHPATAGVQWRTVLGHGMEG
ncbi:hypothetical protein STRIP9103_04006 [Streptomyces ipomoeae 91-03]|uniref:Uncharacterized protein n=1 Tax=Streptomyces ipomoeae 91-03 TaxID=698759 RepID=L1KKG4_9ACTN|nr:hypothetical protein STRIP9103_04006 [Streptomyces ipomoeae 91-03]